MNGEPTPGPWETHEYDLAERTAITSDHGTIAVVSYPDEGCDEANARLIAAAPELLEALELLVQKAILDSRLEEVATTAIAKARGQ